ncbi:MAG: hypothetical protein KKC99_07425, partial [Proteobacteria bacterium]|nr:hypothetical protein [Pseudomonadota bacterium]
MFTQIPDFPEYEISRDGIVRTIADAHPLPVFTHPSGQEYVRFRVAPSKYRSRNINILLFEIYGAGSAEAAGMDEPNMRRAMVQR